MMESLTARRWLETLSDYGEQPYPFYNAYARGRVLLAEKELEAANTQFASVLHDLEDADYALARIEVLVWQSICLRALGKIAEAERS